MSAERMIAAQARVISQLNEEIDDLKRSLAKAESRAYGSRFWIAMQKAIKESVTLHSSWEEFCAVLRLSAPDPGPERGEHWNTLLPPQR